MQTKIAIITGGSRGLGKAAVESLAAHGVDSVFTYRSNKAEADKVVDGVRKAGRKALAVQLDVGKLAEVGRFAEALRGHLQREWGRQTFDFLVNNAGIGTYALLADTTEAQFDALLDVHFKGAFFLTQKILPAMEDGGRIINLSSGLARFSSPGYGAYAAMKGAIEVWTRYLACELGARKITANVVAPGAIETDFGGGMVRDNKELNTMLAQHTALGRVGLPDDVGGVIASLLSDDNRWVNAQRIEVTGGYNI